MFTINIFNLVTKRTSMTSIGILPFSLKLPRSVQSQYGDRTPIIFVNSKKP